MQALILTRHRFSRPLTFACFQLPAVPFWIGAGLMLIRYLRNLSTGRLILWCYFIWYAVVLVRYFDPNWRLWLTSTGLSLIIGLALYISTAKSGTGKVELETWQVIRLFMM